MRAVCHARLRAYHYGIKMLIGAYNLLPDNCILCLRPPIQTKYLGSTSCDLNDYQCDTGCVTKP